MLCSCSFMLHEIPIVDISDFRARGPAAKDVVQQWDTAFRTVGFVMVLGHGVMQETVDELHQCALQFFRRPHEDKMTCCLNKGYGFGVCSVFPAQQIGAKWRQGFSRCVEAIG